MLTRPLAYVQGNDSLFVLVVTAVRALKGAGLPKQALEMRRRVAGDLAAGRAEQVISELRRWVDFAVGVEVAR